MNIQNILMRQCGYAALMAVTVTAIPLPANAQMVQPLPGVQSAGSPAATPTTSATVANADPAPPPAVETAKETKARLKAEAAARKAAEKEAKRAAKAEEKKRKAAERAARPKKNNAALNCALGAGLGILAAVLVGGKRNRGEKILAGAALGCAAGYGLGEILSKRDQEDMTRYVEEDFLLREDLQDASFNATESGYVVGLQKGATTIEERDHVFAIDTDVAFYGNNISVNERVMRSTTSLRLRGSPTTAGDNIVGGLDTNDIILTYGTTLDGQWAYVVEREPDGVYTLKGYAATQYLTTNLNVAPAAKYVRAKVKPVNNTTGTKKAAPATKAVTDRPVRTAQANTFRAPTACKSFTAAAGGKQGNGTNCGGARSLALNIGSHGMGKRA
ncbi:hypothetical protein [Blastomonas fulva]|uniref:hypothetical protein n=1 Tax=Blastomonas fulva TaxID=1550728 RepID=UPI003D2B01DE